MEERFKKLDNFLREQLNGASEDHSWNVPDDTVFEKAMRTVAEQKKKKRRGWILIPILLGAGLIVSEYFHHRQIETLQWKISTLEDKFSSESSTTGPLSPTVANIKDVTSSTQTTTSSVSKEKISLAASSDASTNKQLTPNPETGLSAESINSSIPSTSKNQSLDRKSSEPKAAATQPTVKSKLPLDIATNTDQTKSIELPGTAGSNQPANVATSINNSTRYNFPDESKTTQFPETGVLGMTYSDSWVTTPISTVGLKELKAQETAPFVMTVIATKPTDSRQILTLPISVMQYGLLLGGNQSWLTMTNIPPLPDAILYNYDSSQPGFNMQGFVNKPFSPRFSVQAGLGYNVYRNKSILEDQFLFDSGSVTMMPNGESMYQKDYEVLNPIGEYKMLLEFRASDQMHQNDTIVEYTNIEQTIHSVMLDLGIHYDLLTLNHVKISLGTGFGLGYIAGLKNEFIVSTYYNGALQKNQMETPDQLNNVKRWYGQWLGKLNIGYYPTERLGIILSAQYNAGLTSIREGGSANGPLTFLHSFGLSAGVSNSF
jgi:hypothetical protein